VPWIAVILAVSFALYGFIRKQTPVDPLDGLAAETLLLLPLAAAWLGIAHANGSGAFITDGVLISILLVLGGLLTAVPLALFAAGARRVRMSTLGFLQYLTPSITLILAVTQLGESFTPLDAVSFGSIWTALLLVSVEAPLNRLIRAG
jgi:chloramphenicol-sensitive protein RarD